MREFLPAVEEGDDLGDVVGDEILVRHRQEGRVDAGHGEDLARPEAGGVDDVLGVDVPCSVATSQVPSGRCVSAGRGCAATISAPAMRAALA
jgi:hypothetical protein